MNHGLDSSAQFVNGGKELVRGQEQDFLCRLRPLVAAANITLDLAGTERIDAAGLAALIALYNESRRSGRHFAVANPSLRIRKILRMVGLDTVLLSRDAEEHCCFRPPLQETAAA